MFILRKFMAFGLYLSLGLSAIIGISTPVMAQNISQGFQQRANQLIPLFNQQIAYNDYFASNFLQAIPTRQLDQIITGVNAQYGKAVSIHSIAPNDRNSGIIKLNFEKATATIEMVVNPSAPFLVSGLLVKGFEVIGDDYSGIEREISALPGKAGFAIHRLRNRQAPSMVREFRGSDQFAIGSTFKLYILAELAAQIESGRLRWNDVAPLAPKSSTLGGTEKWPEGSPLSLQSLATLMISVSDNNATDALIAFLGRQNIEARVRSIGHDDINKIIPFLSTAEVFSLKMRANDRLRSDFLRASENEQQNIIARNKNRLSIRNYNAREFASGPLYIDDIEWFASSTDIARIFETLRQSRDPIVKKILSLNSGIGSNDAGKWNYLGYKGGSEPGVISMSFLVQSRQGTWYSVTGSWNDPNKEINQNQWVALMTRILNVLVQSA